MDKATWQARLDSDFPHGLLATWHNQRGPEDPLYRIARPDVIDLIDGHPVVRLDAWDTEKSLVLHITSYQQIRSDPLLVRVHAANTTPAMYFSANLSEELKNAMRPDR